MGSIDSFFPSGVVGSVGYGLVCICRHILNFVSDWVGVDVEPVDEMAPSVAKVVADAGPVDGS